MWWNVIWSVCVCVCLMSLSMSKWPHMCLCEHDRPCVWLNDKSTETCLSVHYSIRVYDMCVCVFVACHSGTPQAVQLSSSSLSKKQAAPSGQPTPPLSSLETRCVCVCEYVFVCVAFTITCTNANTRTCTNGCTFSGLCNEYFLPIHLSLVHTHTHTTHTAA